MLKTEAKPEAFEIVLRDIDTDELLFPKMKYESREDVNDYFLCEYDYTESGVTARIPKRKIASDRIYEVVVRPTDKKHGFATGTYLTEGRLCFVNPRNFVPPQVEGTELREIVENGVLRAYQPDFGTYVYQYDGERKHNRDNQEKC